MTKKYIPPQTNQMDYRKVTEIYVDGMSGIQVRNGVAKLGFFSIRRTAEEQNETVPTAIIAINLSDLVAMTEGLKDAIEKLQEQGFLSLTDITEASEGKFK